jgi:4-carboxymuconolactone decarboxylase
MPALKPERTAGQAFDEGMAVRRRILGNEYVDNSTARIHPHNQDFIDLIVRVGWGEVWTRPGLDYRTRRVLVMGTMVAIGAYEEFTMHAKAALEDDFDLNDIKELLLQQAVYCGAPRANHAFYIVDKLVADLTAKGVKIRGYTEG